MSKRYEAGTADCKLEILAADAAEAAGIEDLAPSDYVLVIGDPWASAYAIVGAPEDLRRFASRVADTVRGIRPVISGSVAESQAELGQGAERSATGELERTPPQGHRPRSPDPGAFPDRASRVDARRRLPALPEGGERRQDVPELELPAARRLRSRERHRA